MIHLMVVLVALSCACEGYTTRCKDDSYFDPKRQNYISCNECNQKDFTLCSDCCPILKKDADAIYNEAKTPTIEVVPSVKYEDPDGKKIVGLFFHILIIVMVVCTLSVIACVGIKAAKDRRTDNCGVENSRHSHNNDADILEEVWVIPPNSATEKPATIGIVNQAQESILLKQAEKSVL